MKKIPKMCLTCEYYEPYHCNFDNSYIGYLNVQELTKCIVYKLNHKYKKGGEWYEQPNKHD